MRILSCLSLVFLAACQAAVDPAPKLLASGGGSDLSRARKPQLKLSFAPAVSVSAGNTHGSMLGLGGPVAADLDGDGHEDIAVASYWDHQIDLYFGRGDGTFQEHTRVQDQHYPNALAVGRFSGGAGMELATMSYAGRVHIFASDPGTRTFVRTRELIVPQLDSTGAFASADFDGDGRVDLAGLRRNGAGGNGLSLLLNGGNSNFIVSSFASGSTNDPYAGMVVGDFSGDGKVDLSFISPSSGRVMMWTHSGNNADPFPVANVDASRQFPANPSPYAQYARIFAGDFNGDGKLDVATPSGSNLVIVPNLGSAWPAPVPFPAGAQPHAVAAADFDLDGIPDLAIADNGTEATVGKYNGDSANSAVGVLLGRTDATFASLRAFEPGRGESLAEKMVFRNRPTALAVADFNQDGMPDIVTVNSNTDTISVLLNTSEDTRR